MFATDDKAPRYDGWSAILTSKRASPKKKGASNADASWGKMVESSGHGQEEQRQLRLAGS